MTYVYIGIGVYYVLGFILTRVILKGTTLRMGFRDFIVAPFAMPVLFVVLMVFDLSEEAWARILVMLDFDPPEKMRAKPIDKFQPDKIDLG
ncbi:MAG: hypothetical protein K1X51_07625 [Rhodospirillaceae bacterium]|nr:hypothetical protein [Rhodospirillaceae bacterium]